jgi:hypothetical protein
MILQLRMAFDPGSGICLWASNEAARTRYGYPVDHWQLPLAENTRRWLSHLVTWFDTSIDWASPGDGDDWWTDAELQRFLTAKQRGLDLVREELPASEFEVVA